MNKHDYKKQIAGTAVALCALAVLAGGAAQAQTATQITTPGQLGLVTFTTPAYPGPGAGQIASPFTTAAGINSIVLTDQNGAVFSRDNVSAASGLDFPVGTKLLQTADANNNDLGPLQIDFSTPGFPNLGVAGFGVRAQNFAFDQESFTLKVFTNGSTVLDPNNVFTFGPFDNSNGATNGVSAFVGALSTPGNTITEAVISSSSFDILGDDGFSNNFYFGPVTVTNVPAVPEASTFVGFGMGVVLFAGLTVATRRRKMSRAPQTAA